MTARNRLSRPFLNCLTIILSTLSEIQSEAGMKYSINDHAIQIFRIVEDTAHSIYGIDIKMEPSYFNYLVPFTTTVTCAHGTMDVSGMEHTHIEDSYMETINETHSYLQAKFAVSDLSYKYDFCWLNFGVPVPIWLRGKVLNSQYFVSAILRYKPKCQVDIQSAQLLSYGKLTVNIFQWMPGIIGNWLLDAITRNAQDRIFATVEKSIKTNAEALTDTYNPCLVFPAMGKMTPHVPNPEIKSPEPDDKLLENSSYIGGLLDELTETEGSMEDSENMPQNSSENGSEIEKIGDNCENMPQYKPEIGSEIEESGHDRENTTQNTPENGSGFEETGHNRENTTQNTPENGSKIEEIANTSKNSKTEL